MIKILLGRQTDPMQDKVLTEAVQNYQNYPEHETFVIVPNHIKFTTEVRAINMLAISQGHSEQSVKNLQVLSFSRLAWFFLKDAEKGLPTELDEAAASMLLAKIIAQKKEQLHLFQTTDLNPGLIKQLYDTILQIREGNLDLNEITTESLTLETKNKIADLKIIYADFIAAIAGKFSTTNEVQLELNEYLNSEVDLSQTDFYFSDFSHFSLQECLTVKLLMTKAHSVTLAFKTELGEIEPKAQPGDYDYVIQNTINKLICYIKSKNLEYQVSSTNADHKPSKRELLNEFWTGEIDRLENSDQVQLVRADNRYAEAYYVAHTIYQQVTLGHYRYSDFLVLAPNLHEYETYLTPILRQNEIPFFNDLQQEMKYHPIVVLIENIAQLLTRPLQTNNMLAIMKTRLIIPKWYQDEASYLYDVDQLENFVLAHGINHNLWRKDFTKYMAAEVIGLDKIPDEVGKINRLKDYFVKQISHLFTNLKAEKDTQKAITIFFNFLLKNGVNTVLEKWRTTAQNKGNLQEARQSEQVWDLLINLLHDYLLINPTDFETASFFNVLINGFKEATFSQIPATLDAVNLSEMGIVQVSGYKQVFVMGATVNGLPQIQNTPGFLSTENLTELKNDFGEDSYIEDRQQLSNLDQNYQFGNCMALAHDKFYLSYSIANDEAATVQPSIYYERLKNAGAPEYNQHNLPENLGELLSFITNPQASLGYLSYLNRTNKELDVDNILKLTKKYLPQRTDKVIAASQFINEPEDIGPKLAQQLYGENLDSSVSQLETFYENSYEYFLTYGLRLHKRFENELDVIQAGNYFHETFDRLVKELNQQSLNLKDIDEVKLQQLLDLARSEMKSEPKYQQLLNDPFNEFLFKCLDHTTSNVAHNWHKAVQKTPLKAKYSELSFGNTEKVQGLQLKVPNISGDHYVNLRGKMDRVDLAQIPDQNEIMAQVVDYKSSAKKFNLGLFYHGISLQMVSYLDVLARNQKFFTQSEMPLSLLGAFYQTVTRQMERINGTKIYNKKLELNKAYLDGQYRLKYTGLINDDQLLLLEAEPELKEPGTSSSLYIGVKSKKKDGSLSFSGSAFKDDELKLLLKYDEELIKDASSQILSGQIKLNPYKYGNGISALTYSDFRDIFFFDAMLKENRYHQIGSMDKPELIKKITERLQEDD